MFYSNIIIQGYLSTSPVIRIRKENESYYLTYKGAGFLSREEHNLMLDKDSFYHLLPKCDGTIIRKTRYLIPYLTYTIEFDQFHDTYDGLYLAEVEFNSEEEANNFIPPSWFGAEVTYDSTYSNSTLSHSNGID